jgi:peroxiredoxin
MDLGFEVVDFEPTDHLEEGGTAPDFERPLANDEYWGDATLSEVCAVVAVVLVFHPMDGAFPTTYMYNEFRDRGWLPSTREGEDEDGEADDHAYELVGLSISTPYEHKTLLEERGVDARVFSDPANGVAESYGIANDLDGMAGVSEPRPAVFVLDGERVVQYAWVASEWPEFPDYDELGAALDGL